MSRREASETVNTSALLRMALPIMRVRVAPGHAARQVLGEQQVDAVVDGHHGGRGAEQGPDVVRGVEEVSPEPAQLPGDRDVLPQAVARGVVHHGHEVLGQVAQGGLVGRVAEEEVRRLPIEVREMAHQVPDVRTDSEVPPLPRVDRDLHRPQIVPAVWVPSDSRT